jgi:hypothetical protein
MKKQQTFESTGVPQTTDWKEEWKDMPEFIQEKKEPYSKIIIRLKTKEDLDEFAELIDQKLTDKTKSIWHPKLERGIDSYKRYVDES